MKKLSLLLAASAIATSANAATIFTLVEVEYENVFSSEPASVAKGNALLDLTLRLYDSELSPGQQSGEVPFAGPVIETVGVGDIELYDPNYAFDWQGKLAFTGFESDYTTSTNGQSLTFDSTCTATGTFLLGGGCPFGLETGTHLYNASPYSLSDDRLRIRLPSGYGDDGQLSLIFEVSEVPVPAAAWLFGSALLSLASIKRRATA